MTWSCVVPSQPYFRILDSTSGIYFPKGSSLCGLPRDLPLKRHSLRSDDEEAVVTRSFLSAGAGRHSIDGLSLRLARRPGAILCNQFRCGRKDARLCRFFGLRRVPRRRITELDGLASCLGMEVAIARICAWRFPRRDIHARPGPHPFRGARRRILRPN